jgi:hypothetical protein
VTFILKKPLGWTSNDTVQSGNKHLAGVVLALDKPCIRRGDSLQLIR